MSTATVTFLAYLRAGASAGIRASGSGRNRATVQARLELSGADEAIERDTRVMGPGDAIGIDGAEIVRVDPPDGTTAHEPRRFPLVEFRHPALPWLFTPAAPAGGRLRPWFTLVVVREREGVALEPGARPGSHVLRIGPPAHAGTELGDPALAAACAHVQVSGEVTPETLAQLVAREPERVRSRVIFPHRLDAGERYLACLVPTFQAGVSAGLGERVEPDAPLADAWSAAAGTKVLPVYHHWRFGTGEHGDFRSLAARLRPRATPPDVGRYRLDVSALYPGTTLAGSGALRAPGSADEPAPREVRAALTVAPPYAAAFGGTATPSPDAAGWFPELNLDPRHRVVAGVGARIVREDQEALVAAAWEQAGSGGDGNALVEQLALACEAGRRLHDAIAPLGTATLEGVAAPALRRMRTSGISDASPAAARAGLLEALDPERTVRARLTTRLQRPEDDRAALRSPGLVAADAGSAAGAPDPLARMLVSPTFLSPMSERVAQTAPELMLPGASLLEPETVSVLETNPAFVAALLAGLNDELARELVWRGFPLDRRSTFFRHFWGGGHGDVVPLEQWNEQAPLASIAAAQAARLVLVVRGELLRRHPGTLLYAVPARQDGDRRTLETAPGSAREPSFRGSLTADLRYFGFALTATEARSGGGDPGWFFVLQQQSTEARLELPDDGELPFAQTSADVAAKALQPAQRVAIHADELLPAASARSGA